jgi:uncharacterized membrane protein YidH (DUF202 family)
VYSPALEAATSVTPDIVPRFRVIGFMTDSRGTKRTIGRRFWIVWVLCYVGMLAIIGAGWLYNPTSANAAAGLPEEGQTLPPRIGFVLFIAIIPLVLASLRLAKIKDSGAPSRVAIPILVALLLVVATWFDSFFPDAIGCGGFDLERFGPPDPECVTAVDTRLLALAEMTIGWILFAALATAADVMQRKRDARRRPS